MVSAVAFPLADLHPNLLSAIEALGNPGWNFKEFQRYLSKSETAYALPEETAKKYGAEVIAPAGTNGPIARSYPTWFSDLHLPLFGAYKALGVDVNVDPVSPRFLFHDMWNAFVIQTLTCLVLFPFVPMCRMAGTTSASPLFRVRSPLESRLDPTRLR